MTLPQQTLKRLPKIKAGLIQGLTIEQIAHTCSVYEKTIDRDLRAFRQSGEFEQWIREEALRLHYIIVQKRPVEAYREIMRLLGKTLTRRVEAKTEITEKVDVNVNVKALLARYEKVITKASNRNLRKNNSAKQVDTAHPDAAAS